MDYPWIILTERVGGQQKHTFAVFRLSFDGESWEALGQLGGAMGSIRDNIDRTSEDILTWF